MISSIFFDMLNQVRQNNQRDMGSIAIGMYKENKDMVLEQYQLAEMEIIEFEAEDIICTSGGSTDTDVNSTFIP